MQRTGFRRKIEGLLWAKPVLSTTLEQAVSVKSDQEVSGFREGDDHAARWISIKR